MKKIRNKKILLDLRAKSFFYIWHRYHFLFFQSLINCGKKLWAFNFIIKLKKELKKQEQIDPLLSLFLALINITPEVLLFPYKTGGEIYSVGMPITIKKQIIFAIKWVIKLLKDKYRIINLENMSK